MVRFRSASAAIALSCLLFLTPPAGSEQASVAGPEQTAAPAGKPAAPDATAGDSKKETIVIRADQAWEEPSAEQVLHFKGNFELRSEDWSLTSDEADLYGPLDDPDRIVARGSPAVVTIIGDEETVIGEGRTIEYQRDTEILTLTEQASIVGERASMRSGLIVYDVAAERLKSSGAGGVEMVLERDER
jgi:lipopolysaccharide transport protein LptA